MNAPVWTPEEKADVAALDWDAFRQRWPRRSYHGWRHKRRELRDERTASAPQPQLTGGAVEPPDIERLMETWIAFEEQQRRCTQLPSCIEVTLTTDRPIGIAFLSDWHCGGQGVDMRRLIEDVHRIRATPGLYVYLGGDAVNNFITDKLQHAGRGDARPAVQWQMARWLMHQLAPQIICAGSGNHDQWTQTLADQDPYLEALRAIPHHYIGRGGYQGEGGCLDLVLQTPQLQPVRYRIYRKHRGRTNVNDPLAGPKGILQRPEFHDIDVAVTEHIHTPAVGCWRLGRREVCGIVTGSYKVVDEHARHYGYDGAAISTPTLILWPGERRLRFEQNLEDAAQYLGQWWG